MGIKVFSNSYLDSLIEEATASPRQRQHRNIHDDYADPCQRLFNAINPDSYLRPHKHGKVQGAETMLAVRGLLAVVVFDDQGNIQQIQRFGITQDGSEQDIATGIEIAPGQWHTVLALEPESVLVEMKGGPFDPNAAKYFAPWAPDEGSPEGTNYLNELRAMVTALAFVK